MVALGPPWDDADAFHTHVRAQHRSLSKGPCVLDVGLDNILGFSGFSSFETACLDLRSTLPPHVAAQVVALCEVHGVPDAFRVRRELVNFKKVCLLVAQDAADLELSLKRLCVYFFCDLVRTRREAPEHRRYVSLSQTLMQCKGALQAVFDARNLTKALCSVPRHPQCEKPYPKVLRTLPQCLGVFRHMSRARAWAQSHADGGAVFDSEEGASDTLGAGQRLTQPSHADAVPEAWGPVGVVPEVLRRGHGAPVGTTPAAQTRRSSADAVAGAGVGTATRSNAEASGGASAPARLETGAGPGPRAKAEGGTSASPAAPRSARLEALVADVRAQRYPGHVAAYIEQVFVARGVAKVCLVWEELGALVRALQGLPPALEAALGQLDQVHVVATAVRDRMHRDMHTHTLRGALRAVRDLAHWTAAIYNLPSGSAGDAPPRPPADALPRPPSLGSGQARAHSDAASRVQLQPPCDLHPQTLRIGACGGAESACGGTDCAGGAAVFACGGADPAAGGTDGAGAGPDLGAGGPGGGTGGTAGDVLFRAGESARHMRSAMFVPLGFDVPGIFAGLKAAVGDLDAEMRAALDREGGPTGGGAVLGRTRCGLCRGAFNKVWVAKGVCCACEARYRRAGRCPYGARCPAAAFCPHAAKCAVCDGWSCDACGLVRGDGEAVVELADALRPRAVFLDFDQTLCTTKRGGSPLTGRHGVDADLHGLLLGHGDVHIVTRNPHGDDICAFLRGLGVPAALAPAAGRGAHSSSSAANAERDSAAESGPQAGLDPRPPGGPGSSPDLDRREHAGGSGVGPRRDPNGAAPLDPASGPAPHPDAVCDRPSEPQRTGAGAPRGCGQVAVHVVGNRKGRDKASVIREVTDAAEGRGGRVLFVDDDIREHCAPSILALGPRVCRVLFVRGLT